ILHKSVTVRVTITEWDEPAKVGFTLKATNENVAGDGYFLAEPTGPDTTKVTGYLDLRPGGRLAPVANVFMKQLMPKVTLDFAKALANKIEEEYRSQG
ncbi:MAG: SRPBCC family protein, partial [Chloroflexi bacterium]|nr:SRPBCC family protein [Chloroflexota bacterium]